MEVEQWFFGPQMPINADQWEIVVTGATAGTLDPPTQGRGWWLVSVSSPGNLMSFSCVWARRRSE